MKMKHSINEAGRWAIALWLACFMATSMVAQTTVAAPKMNIVYRGVNNPLEVVSTEPLDTLIVEGGTVEEWERLGLDAARILVRPHASGPNTLLIIAVSDAGLQDTSYFRIKKPLEPVVVFAGQEHGAQVRAIEAMVAPGIAARMNNFDFEALVRIDTYNMVIQRPLAQRLEIYKGVGGRFTTEQQAVLCSLEEGSVISFEDIQVTLSDYFPYPDKVHATYTIVK